MACDGGYDELLIDAERVMLLAAILVSARLLRRSAAAASVSGRWRRLDGLKEGDFIPLARLSTFALTANFFRGVTPRDGVVCRESSRIASRNAV